MGISGLLQALKAIQVTKSLSDFSGQTIAVDAYVWLHKGVYSCATELATGKPTSKYVHYAMERVRILRHHGIEPYIVFDGGPLQAKKGTEVDRKKKREENIARGNAFAAQGRTSQARDCYNKAVDVTPQMAFQLIKALRVEGVKYIVAPYEADAQLAFLEKEGIVSGILTEDSDLLVFSCKNVLFKLDTTARTVVSISQADFGSVTSSGDNPISLVGWSDKQFREMAILSGCDYLPSIPGIGLKTACTLLRKWKTADQVVRSIALEGKKMVPKGYIQQFRLAEKCFLYQRVYDPRLERLVHLNNLPEVVEWDEVADNYVGRDLDPLIAKALAMGDKDPTSYEDMVDINPGFVPRTRVLQDVPLTDKSVNRSLKATDKMREVKRPEGILSFFGPNPKIPHIPKSPSKRQTTGSKRKMTVGDESGKRTLVDIHDHDLSARKKTRAAPTTTVHTQSRFFGAASASTPRNAAPMTPIPGPSRLKVSEKENEIIDVDEEEVEEAKEADSLVAQYPSGSDDDWGSDDEDEVVEQEDGYMSPTYSRSRDTEELSSPPRPRTAPQLGTGTTDGFDFGAEFISSPPSAGRSYGRPHSSYPTSPTKSFAGKVLIEASPEPEIERQEAVEMLDLRDSFEDVLTENDATPSPPSLSPLTPEMNRDPPAVVVGEAHDPDEGDDRTMAARSTAVAAGWRNMWSLGPSGKSKPPLHEEFTASLRRSGTNVTPTGRHRLTGRVSSHPYLHRQSRTPNTIPSKPFTAVERPLKGRRSLVFVEANPNSPNHSESPVESLSSTPVNSAASREVDAFTRSRLERFKWSAAN